MKVCFIPYNRNPYQKCLSDSLQKKGAEVYFGTKKRYFSLFRTFLKNLDTKIIHIHWIHPLTLGKNKRLTVQRSACFILDLLLMKILKIKIVWTVHNIINHEGKHKSIELFFTKILTRLTDEIIIHSPSAKKEFIKTYKTDDSKITIIPHGNYQNCYKNTIKSENARKRLNLKQDDKVFLFIGQIRSYKGIYELIDTFKKLDCLKAKLLIAGKPHDEDISDNILKKSKNDKRIKKYLRYIDDGEFQIFLNASDVVVLPYKKILTSGAAILSLSFGKPIIAPHIGCLPDLLDNKGSIIYDPMDKHGLVHAMEQSLKSNLKKMGKHNFTLAKLLNWDDIAKKTYNVYLNS